MEDQDTERVRTLRTNAERLGEEHRTLRTNAERLGEEHRTAHTPSVTLT
jgi:hypothetical protein